MSDIPILFSGEMVREILAGRKTQTRRRLRHQPEHGAQPCWYNRGGWAASRIDGSCSCKRISPAPPRIGATLWVRETWCDQGQVSPDDYPMICYRADGAWHHHDYRSISGRYDESFMGPPTKPWRPSIHMPRWASRLTLRVTDVRVERAQDITEEAARAEGFASRDAFAEAWTAIYGAGSWRDNPWVWVVAFEVVR